MKTVISLLITFSSVAAFSQWTSLESGTLNELSAALVDDAETYWVGGEFGMLMHTTDGGDTWTT
nr:oxidoreductase [Bacteroidota bacterium]